MRLVIILSLLAVLLIPSSGFPANTIIVTDDTTYFKIGKYIQFLEDQQKSLTIEDITAPGFSGNFNSSNSDTLNFGYTNSAYWLKFSVKSGAAEKSQWLLGVDYSLIDDIRLFTPDSEMKYREKKAGRLYPFSTKEFKNRKFAFSIALNPGSERTCFIRVESKDSLPLPVSIWSPQSYNRHDHREQLYLGLYYGLIMIMILYNLFIYFSVRDINYLFYVLTLITMHGLFQMGINGLTYEYIGQNSLWWARTSIAFFISTGILFGVLFCMAFLNTRKTLPLFHKLLVFSVTWAGITAIMSFFIDYFYTIQTAVIMAMFAGTILFISGCISFFKGNRAARFYMLSWVPCIIGGLIYGLKAWSLLPSNLITEYGYQIGSAMQAALLSIALGDNINILRREKFIAQEAMLNKEREFSKELENLVEERTHELNITLDDLKGKDEIIEYELSIAADIQHGILPSTPISYNGVNITSYYQAMEKIGGDFYDIFTLKGGYLCVLISDVSGHGIPAAFVTAMAKILFHEATGKSKFPRDIFRFVNDQLINSMRTQDYLTCFIIIIGPSYEVYYSNASHPRSLLLRNYTGEFEEWDTDGLFIGAMTEANEKYEEKQDMLDFGDRLILFTDGLVEARNSEGVEFGLEEVKKIIKNNSRRSLEETRDAIIYSWKEFTGGTEIKDDVTFLILEIDPSYKTLLEHKSKGLECFYHEDYKEASMEFKKALEIDNKNLEIHHLLGKCCFREKDYNASIEHLEKYIESITDDADAWNLLAASEFNIKNYDHALEASKKACQIRPNYIKAMEVQAMSLKKMDRISEAKPLWEKILRIDPENISATSELQIIKDTGQS